MKRFIARIQHLALIFAVVAASTLPIALPQPAYAACGGGTGSSKDEVLAGVGQAGDCQASGVTQTVKGIVNILSYILGIAAVIMIIVSGFKYVTAGGDSNRVSSAKNTLIYALIGLLIAAIAQALVHWVLGLTAK